MFATVARRLATSAETVGRTATKAVPRTCADIRYLPKKVWPPDFKKLSRAEQFNLEKRHKRRLQLATTRSRWDRYLRLVQMGLITGFLIYALLFMETESQFAPTAFRKWFWDTFGLFSASKRSERRQPETSTTDQK